MIVGRLAAGIAGTTGAGGMGVLVQALMRITAAHPVPAAMWLAIAGLFVVTAVVGACRFSDAVTVKTVPAGIGPTGISGLAAAAQVREAPTDAAELRIVLRPFGTAGSLTSGLPGE